MTWEAVCAQYPNQWIIFEAHQWEDEGDERHILDMSVVQMVEDASTAFQTSNALLKQHTPRLFYPAHTSTNTPRIKPPLPLVRIPKTYERHPSTVPAK